MTWTVDGKWECELCSQVVNGVGPWCQLYRTQARQLCRPLAKEWLHDADSRGDGPLVNALCELGRRMWGEDMDW